MVPVQILFRTYNFNLILLRQCHSKDSEDSTKNLNGKNSNNNEKVFPEPPTTCCMSGCANCVWLEYAEKLQEYFKDGGEKAFKEINEKVTDQNMKMFLFHELRMRGKKR